MRNKLAPMVRMVARRRIGEVSAKTLSMRVSVSTGAIRLPSPSDDAKDLPSRAEISPVRIKLAQAWLLADFASPAKLGAACASVRCV